MMYCPLTLRQKFLYSGLKNKISIDELLHTTGSACQANNSAVTTSLMNLVMQFRKVSLGRNCQFNNFPVIIFHHKF